MFWWVRKKSISAIQYLRMESKWGTSNFKKWRPLDKCGIQSRCEDSTNWTYKQKGKVAEKNGDAKKHQLLNHDLGLKPIVTWGLGDPKNDLRNPPFLGKSENLVLRNWCKKTIFREPLVNVNKQLWKIAMLLIGKSTISLGHFPVRKLLNYEMVYSGHFTWNLFSAETFAAWNCA